MTADQIVGTGIAVSTDGKIVTCAHVVQAAGIDPRNVNGAEVGIYFPQARGGEEKESPCKSSKVFSTTMTMIWCCLQFIEGSSPLAPEQIRGAWNGGLIGGKSISYVWLQSNWKISSGSWRWNHSRHAWNLQKIAMLQVDPVQLKSREIDCGHERCGSIGCRRAILLLGLWLKHYYPKMLFDKTDIGYGR